MGIYSSTATFRPPQVVSHSPMSTTNDQSNKVVAAAVASAVMPTPTVHTQGQLEDISSSEKRASSPATVIRSDNPTNEGATQLKNFPTRPGTHEATFPSPPNPTGIAPVTTLAPNNTPPNRIAPSNNNAESDSSSVSHNSEIAIGVTVATLGLVLLCGAATCYRRWKRQHAQMDSSTRLLPTFLQDPSGVRVMNSDSSRSSVDSPTGARPPVSEGLREFLESEPCASAFNNYLRESIKKYIKCSVPDRNILEVIENFYGALLKEGYMLNKQNLVHTGDSFLAKLDEFDKDYKEELFNSILSSLELSCPQKPTANGWSTLTTRDKQKRSWTDLMLIMAISFPEKHKDIISKSLALTHFDERSSVATPWQYPDSSSW